MENHNLTKLNSNVEKFINVGVDAAFLEKRCSMDIINCNVITIQLALYWAALIVPTGYKTRIMIYKGENVFDRIFDDLSNGTLDIFPFEITMNYSHMATYQYHWTTPIGSTGYIMYSGRRSVGGIVQESPVKFLISPFSDGVWICVIISAISSFIILPFIFRKRHYKSYSKNIFVLVELTLTFLMVLYSSGLKAFLASPSTNIPFENLYDLANKIEEGSKKLIIEDKRSLRWGIFTREDISKLPPVQAVYNAIYKHGFNKSLLYEPNMTKICQLLVNSTEYVYFGYEEKILAFCHNLCTWKYPVSEYPETPVMIPVSRYSPIVKYSDLMAHALPAYREALIKRNYGKTCNIHHKSDKVHIGIRSIFGATAVFGFGLILAIGCLVTEIFMMKLRPEMLHENLML